MGGGGWEVRRRWKEREKQTKIATAQTSAQADLKVLPSLRLNAFHLCVSKKKKKMPSCKTRGCDLCHLTSYHFFSLTGLRGLILIQILIDLMFCIFPCGLSGCFTCFSPADFVEEEICADNLASLKNAW